MPLLDVAVRDANASDAAAIAAIYNHAVTDTTAIWNETTVDAANRAAWIAERQDSGFPVLVAEVAGAAVGPIIGYASYGPWRPHDGFRHTVEHSVYVATDAQRQGVASALMTSLIARARDAGLHVMIGGIAADNAVSLALHARFGFKEVARMPQVGAKFGRWLDLVFVQRTLNGRAAPSFDQLATP